MAPALTLTARQARRSILARQRLLGAQAQPLAATVSALAWIPMVSRATPYLALAARGALPSRDALDDAAHPRGELEVTPGPRGLTWLVPAAEAPVARAFALADHRAREERVAAACGLTARDLTDARDALRAALVTPRTPDALRAALAPALLRPLGAAARRAGVSTLAGLSLRGLWAQGEVQRATRTGRLDDADIAWTLVPQPRAVPGAADAVERVRARWLAAHAPVRAKDFAAAFDLATGRAAAALEALRPTHVRVEGSADDHLAPEGFEAPPDGPLHAALLPLHDPLTHARESLSVIGDAALARRVALRGVGTAPLCLVDGAVVGTWHLDAAGARVHPLGPLDAEAARLLEALAARVTALVRDALGGRCALHDGRHGRGHGILPGDLDAVA